jgi:predicted Rossmann fold nucleotide-binding protein DprA/Smf involved in DNA uptake
MIRLAVIGSRTWTDYNFIYDAIKGWKLEPDDIVVSGGATGADQFAEKAAKMLGFKTQIFYPEYEKYGKEAPLVRNRIIVESSDGVLAFWDLKSVGTLHALKIAKQLGKPITIFVK